MAEKTKSLEMAPRKTPEASSPSRTPAPSVSPSGFDLAAIQGAAGNMAIQRAAREVGGEDAPVHAESALNFLYTAVQSLSEGAFDALGSLDESTINGAIEWALANPVTGPLIRSHPVLAAQEAALDTITATPGALQAIWTFIKDPQTQINALEEAVRPHVWRGVQLARTEGEELLQGLGVPEPYVATAGKVLESAASVAGSAAELVIDDVIVDTVAFYRLRSERESYNEAWQKYDAGLIDTHDIIIEHISFVLSVLGRLEDIVSVVLWAAGLVGVGAAGGTAGTVAPGGGNVVGAGAGAGAGAGVGLTASEVFGFVVSLGPAALEVEKMAKAGIDLLATDQTDEQWAQDHAQIASGAMSLAIMAALAFLPGLALRLGKRLARRILEMLPDVVSLLPRAARALEEVASAVPTHTPAPVAGSRELDLATTSRAAPTSGGAAEPAMATQARALSSVGRSAPTPSPRAGSEAPLAPASVSAPPASASAQQAPTSDALPNNVRAFPAERARPQGQTAAETPGELVQLPTRPRPEEPEPPKPQAGAADIPPSIDDELEEVMTGTGPSVVRQKPRAAPDEPVAMAGGDGPKKPPEGAPAAPAVPKSKPIRGGLRQSLYGEQREK